MIGQEDFSLHFSDLQAQPQYAHALEGRQFFRRKNDLAREQSVDGYFFGDMLPQERPRQGAFILSGGWQAENSLFFLRLPLFFQQRGKMPFAFDQMGPDPQHAGARRQSRQGKGNQMKIGMLFQKRLDDPFVFNGVEGAGAVCQPAAGSQHGGGIAQDTRLPSGAACRGGALKALR